MLITSPQYSAFKVLLFITRHFILEEKYKVCEKNEAEQTRKAKLAYVKCPVLLPSVVDRRSRNPLYYYYYIYNNSWQLAKHVKLYSGLNQALKRKSLKALGTTETRHPKTTAPI